MIRVTEKKRAIAVLGRKEKQRRNPREKRRKKRRKKKKEGRKKKKRPRKRSQVSWGHEVAHDEEETEVEKNKEGEMK